MARIPYASTGIPGPGSINIFRMLANAPTLLPLLAQQGQTQYTLLSLPTRLRELVILYSSLRFSSAYEHAQHVAISQASVSDAQRAELERAGGGGGDRQFFGGGRGTTAAAPDDVFSAQELAMLTFLEAVVNGPTVDEGVFAAARAQLTERQMVEVVVVQGYYYELARIATVFEVDIDEMPPPGVAMHEKVDDDE